MLSGAVNCLLFSLLQSGIQSLFGKEELIEALIYLAGGIVVAIVASKRGRSPMRYFFGSLVFSPILMLIPLFIPHGGKILAALVVLICVLIVYDKYSAMENDSSAGGPPTFTERRWLHDDLLSIAGAEMRTNGTYKSLAELKSGHQVPAWVHVNGRAGYAYTLETSGSNFIVRAKYVGPGEGFQEYTVSSDDVKTVRVTR